jgi:hypothetical protein
MTFSTRALRAGSTYLHPAVWERLMGPYCTSSPRRLQAVSPPPPWLAPRGVTLGLQGAAPSLTISIN